jgi:hypothetical protein
MDTATLRAWWAHRQGLDGSLAGATPADVLCRIGWARSIGGANPYLTLFSRAGTSREEADAAVAALAIHELPSARGCAYVVPAEEFSLALRAGGACGPSAELATAKKFLGVTDDEVERLCHAVLAALDKATQPLDPSKLKGVVGDAVRNLGDEGRKRGQTTTLPLALGLLQTAGEIRRVPVNGRLDQQRYGYVRWKPSPVTHGRLPLDTEIRTELARRYFHWTGPASMAHFRWFSGLGVRDAKAAVAPLDLVPIDGTDLLLHPDDQKSLADFVPPSGPQYALVASTDSVALLRRDAQSLLADADAARIPALADRAGGSLADLPHHAILDRGRVVGLWDFDVDAGEIVWAAFVPPDDELRAAVARTEAFVRDQLGDARSFSLDSPASRAPRLAALRSMS